jgi:hypothetical protein
LLTVGAFDEAKNQGAISGMVVTKFVFQFLQKVKVRVVAHAL